MRLLTTRYSHFDNTKLDAPENWVVRFQEESTFLILKEEEKLMLKKVFS